jgi:hypothetical protein
VQSENEQPDSNASDAPGSARLRIWAIATVLLAAIFMLHPVRIGYYKRILHYLSDRGRE